jgi:Spy/CpxP family protein refolding chaperone
MKIRLIVTLLLLIFIPRMALRAETAPNLTNVKMSVEDSYQQEGQQAEQKETKKAGSVHPLSEAQKQAIKSLLDETKKSAGPLLLPLGQTVKEIHENMLSEKPDEVLNQKLIKKITEVTSELINVKIQTNQKIVNLLTPEQKQTIKDELAKQDAPTDLFDVVKRVFDIPEK